MAKKGTPAKLGAKERAELLDALKTRFESHMHRHEGVSWPKVVARLEADPGKLGSLAAMESTGGEPDVVGRDAKTGEYLFYDCAAESPDGRRSLCYDEAALEARKKHKPEGSAVAAAAAMGAVLLTEEEYHGLQAIEPVDGKTSSWLRTPADVRGLGGAIFGDRRFGRVFVYHNGADSYYAARGFRCVLRV